MQILIWFCAIGAVALGGVFFAFSSFVMTALGKLQPAEGIRAMQQINIDVLCASFVLLFFGLPLGLVALALMAWRGEAAAPEHYFFWAAAIYCGGSLLVTMLGNVPLNNRLARVDADTQEAAQLWRFYQRRWTQWNHLRTLACVLTGFILLWGHVMAVGAVG